MRRILFFIFTLILLNGVKDLSAQDVPEIRRKGRVRTPKAAPAEQPKTPKPSKAPKPQEIKSQTKDVQGINSTTIGYIEGIIFDEEAGEPLINATVLVDGTSLGAITDFDGKFIIKNVPAGTQKLTVKYIGYLERKLEVNVLGGKSIDIGTIQLPTNAIGIEAVEVVAQLAVDRVTPVAVSTVDVQFRNERFGSQEFPELLKLTPGVYASKSGGGFGDSRIAIRGFGQENIAVLINGIPVNDMENGRVFWSNWAGLSDVIRTLQVQRGLGASKIAINSVGGTINLVTKTTDIEKGGSITFEGSNYYSYKATVALSTGRTEKGFAASFVGSRTYGQGYMTQTPMDAWSYFLSLSQEIGKKHILSFTALGAPQVHGQRFTQLTMAEYELRNDYRFNADWGYLDGQPINTNMNFYHKPQVALNHYFSISEKTSLNSSAYASFGRGGGGSNFLASGVRFSARDANGQWDYEAARRLNRNGLDTLRLGSGQQVIGNRSDVIIANSINSHNWYGLLSTLNHKFNDNLKLLAGYDFRYYYGLHYREVSNLLGGDFFADGRNRNTGMQAIRMGQRFDYDYDGSVMWNGGFGQLEYTDKRLSVFVSATLSETRNKRIDNFEVPEKRESPTYSFVGYNIKGGVNYRINSIVNVFANTGYFTRAPYFNSMFVDRRRSNDVLSNLTNEKITSVEAGLGFRFKKLTFDINGYYTDWQDKLFVITYPDPSGSGLLKGANATGLGARHYGIELEGLAKPVKFLQINFMASIGDWRWKNDVEAVIIDELGSEQVRRRLLIKDLHVGNAAQTTAALGLRFQLTPHFYIIADYTYFARLFANFDPETRVSVENKPDDRNQPWQVPDYGLVDLHLGYDFKISGLDATIRGDVFNLFNKKYILEAQDGAAHNAASARVFYGFGTYFNLSMQVRF